MRPTASSLLLKCRWSMAPRRHSQPETVASGVMNKKHTTSPKRVLFSCWGSGFLSHCRQNRQGKCQHREDVLASTQSTNPSLWGLNMEHVQDAAFGVPRDASHVSVDFWYIAVYFLVLFLPSLTFQNNKPTISNMLLTFCLVSFSKRECLTRIPCFSPEFERCNKI